MLQLSVHCADSIYAEADLVGDTVWVTITPNPDNYQSGVNLFLSSVHQCNVLIGALARARLALVEANPADGHGDAQLSGRDWPTDKAIAALGTDAGDETGAAS